MGERPLGVVTFLFSDIEGSTWLVQHLGEAYDAVLQVHRELLRGAWAAHDGYELGTEGDSFVVAFDTPSAAVEAAIDAQRALLEHPWADGLSVRVRMGIHTGEVRQLDGDYVGLALHQGARIASAAHGGQVLVSETTREGLSESQQASWFTDLGRHRLKDLQLPVRLFQLAVDGLPSSFPQVRTLTSVPHNLPVQQTSLIGRAADVDAVVEAVREARVVTITAAGGAGKTRVALQVAAEAIDDFPDGAWFVDLAPIGDPALVASAAADALGIREQPGREITATLVDALVGKRTLVILDNCEHLIDACAELADRLVATCPEVNVLATSREALNIPAEVTMRLRSLKVPTEDDVDVHEAIGCEAVELFMHRAAIVRSDFLLDAQSVSPVVQICRRLDGLPLAIELAAARVRSMSVHDIAARLDDRFRLLTGGSRMSLPRQRTLEAAVSWSYDMLSDVEKMVFARLSVFAGGCSLAAAQEVCSGGEVDRLDVVDIIDRLVQRSLLVIEDSMADHTRYKMLETLRQFAAARLIEDGSAASVRDQHLAWAVTAAEQHPAVTPLPGAVADADNFRTAIEWATDTGDQAAALRISGSVWVGHFDERKRLYERMLPPDPGVPPDVAGRAFFAAGALAFMMGDWAVGAERLRASVDANVAVGDRPLAGMSLCYEGLCRWGLGDVAAARRLIDGALAEARSCGDTGTETRALMARGWLETENDVDAAARTAIKALDIARALADAFEVGHCQELLGFAHCLRGDYEEGAAVLADAALTFRRIQHNCAAHIIETAAAWAAMTQRFTLGAELWGAAERIRDETQDKPRPWERAVQEEWLPTITRSLPPEERELARARGKRFAADEALVFTATVLNESLARTASDSREA